MSLSIWAAAGEAPGSAALVAGGVTWTYAELAELAGRALAELRSRPLEPPLALQPQADVASVVLLHALIGAGQPVLLIHPRLTAPERRELLADSGAGTLLVPDPNAWRDGGALVATPDPAPDDERPLAVLFTSGTTRRPKGVVLSRRAFAAAARASAENLGVALDDRWLLCLPLAHVAGLSILTRCLLARRCVVLATPGSGETRVGPRRIAALIDAERVTLVSLVPSQLSALLELAPRWTPPSRLRAILLGGASASPALLARAADRGWPVLTTHGLSEACSQVTTQRLGTVNRGELGSGPPVAGVELRIDHGAIHVRGPTLFSGYWRSSRPALDADGWFDTGDLGELDAQGRLHVRGRRDDLIVSGGENVSPTEVEAVLEGHPDLLETCVFGVPDPVWGQIVAAALVPAPGRTPGFDAVARWASERLAAHKLPRRWCSLPRLERLPSGKLDRRSTATRAQPLLVDPAHSAPQTR